MPATSLTLRLQKGSPLTYTELDNNFLFITSSISSSINTAISGSVNRVAVFSSANKITGSSILTDNGTSLTITGPLTVSGNDAVINGVKIGRGGSSNQYNTAVGYFTLNTNDTGYSNTAVGYLALTSNDTGYSNTAVGHGASSAQYSGNNTTAVGYFALGNNETGYNNTVIGSTALRNNTTGYLNIALGSDAGLRDATDDDENQNSNTSIFIGPYTKPLQINGVNEIVIGYAATGSGNNSVTLGNTSITKTILRSNVGIGTSSPSYSLDVNGTTRVTGTTLVTGSLLVTGSNTLIGTKIITGSVFVSGSKTVIGTNTITGSLNISGSNTLIGTKVITGSVFISGSKTIIGTNTITGSLLVSGSTHTIKGTTTISGSLNIKADTPLVFNTNVFNTPTDTATPIAWVSVSVAGSPAAWFMPLYQ